MRYVIVGVIDQYFEQKVIGYEEIIYTGTEFAKKQEFDNICLSFNKKFWRRKKFGKRMVIRLSV